MIGVLLVNMGGPQSPMEMKQFLKRMFLDPCILQFNKIGRFFLSFIISNTRYKKSWKKYIQIGGSPIIRSTNTLRNTLNEKLDEKYIVKAAYSYSSPLIKEAISEMYDNGITKIHILTMYPHSSISTTKSIERDVKKALRNRDIEIINCGEYYHKEEFVNFWTEIIKSHIKEHLLNSPSLIFSAHSIPEYHIEKGDNYAERIKKSAKLIASNLNLEFEIAYQSQMKRGKWLGPETDYMLKKKSNLEKEVIIIPISFINENLETLYDIDHKLISDNKENFKSLTRVRIPEGHPLLIKLFQSLIIK